MLSERLPEFVRQNDEAHERKHASAILGQDRAAEWRDVLAAFRLRRS